MDCGSGQIGVAVGEDAGAPTKRLGTVMDVDRICRRFEHAGEIHKANRGQGRFPPALSAQPADPGILVRGERSIQAGCAHRFN